MQVGFTWGLAMVLSNVCLLPLDRTIYGTDIGAGTDGRRLHFQRPFFLELVMFLAMAGCLLLEVPAWRARRAADGGSDRGLLPPRRVMLRLLAPAACDLVGSWFVFTGALWVPASIVEMLGCSNVVFTALLSCTMLGKRLERHEAWGVAVLFSGLLAVGTARLASAQDAQGDEGGSREQLPFWATPLGLLMVLMANLWYALEFVVTEKLIGECDISAFVSVGVMGLWGILMYIPLYLMLGVTPSKPENWAPAWHEDFGSSLADVAARPALLIEVAALWLALLLFNAAAFKTTEHLSAMTRVVLAQLVSPLVWLVDLSLAWIGLTSSNAVERLTLWSCLQLLGYAVLVSGNLIYNAVVAPCGARGGETQAREASVSLVQTSGN